MGKISTFRNLMAWQKAMELSKVIYRATQSMPADEKFGLTLQMRRASVSVPSNIAEGYGRQLPADFCKFRRNSRGSLNELTTQYQLAWEMEMIPRSQQIIDLIEEVDRILQGLIRSVERRRS